MNVFPTLSTENNITNYINQYNTGFSLKQINSIQAPPGLEPVPERRKSYNMPSELYDSLQNQEMILNQLTFNNVEMPFREIDKELFYNKACKDQVDRKSLEIFLSKNEDCQNETSTRKGSESSESEDQDLEYNADLNRELLFLMED